MNADTRSPHLDLADLIAEASGQAVTDSATGHLASCAHCRAEAGRWNLVADGVRGVAAALPEQAKPARRRRRGPRGLSGLRAPAGLGRRPVLAVGAAAAVVLLGGVIAALSGHAPGTAGTGGPALTAVTGCTALGQASGTLAQANGGALLIRTVGGRLVAVTATAATRVSVSGSGALADDITDGAAVVVAGPSSSGTIAAARIAVGNASDHDTLAALPGTVVAQGTAADASPVGFTVVTSTGARVPVTISGGTSITLIDASLGQLRAGASTIAVGSAGPGGTLSAIAVFQPPALPGAHATVTVRDCSPSSVDRAVLALAAAG